MSQSWLWLWRGDLRRRETATQQQLAERSEILWARQPQRCQGQCRRRAGGASGAEQNLPAAQKRPKVEQAVPSSPWAPHRADLHMQPWRSPQHSSECSLKEAQPMESPCRSPGPDLQSVGQESWEGLPPTGAMQSSSWRVGPHGAMFDQHSESCSLWEAYVGSVQEGWHAGGGTPRSHRGRTTTDQQRWSVMDWLQPPFPWASLGEEGEVFLVRF